MRLRALTIVAAVAAMVGGVAAPPPWPAGPPGHAAGPAVRPDPLHDRRGPAHPRPQLAQPRLRVRLRLRQGQPVHDGQRLRHGRGAAVPVLRADRHGHPARQRRRRQQPGLRPVLPADHRLRRGAAAWRRAVSPTEQQVEAGYVKGYNTYLAHVGGAAGVPDPTCRGQAWVKPITLLDSYLRFYQLMLLSSSERGDQGISRGRAAEGSGQRTAQPSAAASAAGPGARSPPPGGHQRRSMGSNAVAIGSAGTRDHRGLLLGNPHFPWIGTERFFQAQLTIPGKINVTGASLYGVPLDPHRAQRVGGVEPHRVDRVPVHPVPAHPGEGPPDGVPAERQGRGDDPAQGHRSWRKQPDGSLASVTHTLWWTRYGPVFNNLEGISLPWSTARRSPSPTPTPATSPGRSTPGSASTARPPPSRCWRS